MGGKVSSSRLGRVSRSASATKLAEAPSRDICHAGGHGWSKLPVAGDVIMSLSAFGPLSWLVPASLELCFGCLYNVRSCGEYNYHM
jgi:hypothetical protein